MTDDANREMPSHHVRIVVTAHGPYHVTGTVRLDTREPVCNDAGEPVDWKVGQERPVRASLVLCRCGHSAGKPYCDGTHVKIGFDGTCTADPAPGTTRRKPFAGVGMTMTDDTSLCAGYAFCDRHGSVWREIAATGDAEVRARVQREIANCPSGRLEYLVEGSDAPVETPVPPTIALVPDGPLWVLGGIPIRMGDVTYEVRHRQLLCRCGGSKNKPFCDGSHRDLGFRAP